MSRGEIGIVEQRLFNRERRMFDRPPVVNRIMREDEVLAVIDGVTKKD